MFINKSKILSFLASNRASRNTKVMQYVLQINRFEYKKLEVEILKKYNFFYWNKPEENFKFLSVVESSKPLKVDAKILGCRVTTNYKNGKNIIPLFVGGKKFTNSKNTVAWQDFESEEWLLPRFMIIERGNKYLLVINFVKLNIKINIVDEINNLYSGKKEAKNNIKPGIIFLEKLNTNKWEESVKNILYQINRGKVFKTVLANKICATLKNKIDEKYLANILFRNNKTGYLFLFKKNNSLFFGASPEKLFSIKNNLLQTEALASTTKRGKNNIEDKKLESELLNSKKNLIEHKSVVKYILNELNKISTKIKISSSIKIKKLKYVQHLQTPITAKIKKEKNVFDIIKLLHPTPAVCGFPKNNSLNLINKLEKFDRGLYSGVIGWGNKSEAEFTVAIRSALIKKNKLFAFAGSGIVKDSVPLDELNEINFKLKTILELFKK